MSTRLPGGGGTFASLTDVPAGDGFLARVGGILAWSSGALPSWWLIDDETQDLGIFGHVTIVPFRDATTLWIVGDDTVQNPLTDVLLVGGDGTTTGPGFHYEANGTAWIGLANAQSFYVQDLDDSGCAFAFNDALFVTKAETSIYAVLDVVPDRVRVAGDFQHQTGKFAIFGAALADQQPAPTTLEQVIAILQTFGFAAS